MCNHNFDDTNEEYLSDSDESLRDGYKKCTASRPSPGCEKYHNSKWKTCQSCRYHLSALAAKRRNKNISQGKCLSGCGPIDWSRSKSQCAKCLDRVEDNRKKNISQGLCRIGCGPIDWSRSESQCAKCLDNIIEKRNLLVSQGWCVRRCGRKRVNARYCDICNNERHVWDDAYIKSEKGNESRKRNSAAPVDIDNCLEKATRNEQGEPLGTWTGVPVSLDDHKAWNYRNGDHADSDLKGLLVVDDANPSNWDICDGPHNWTLETGSFNFHKGPRCIYVVYEENDPRFPMRPLDDILKDLIRQRVRIPPPKDESVLSQTTVELVNKYRDIQVSTWVYNHSAEYHSTDKNDI